MKALGVGLVGLLLLSGCTSTPSDAGASPDTSSPTPSAEVNRPDPGPTATATTETPAESETDSCDELLASGWQMGDSHPDVSWDAETGIAAFQLNNEVLVLDLYNDEACQDLPGIGVIVRDLLKDD